MGGRINVFAARPLHDDAAGMFDHAALTFIVTDERRKHGKAGGVSRGESGRAQRVALQIEPGSIRRFPICAVQLRLPRLEGEARAGLDNNRMAIAALIVSIVLPIRESVGVCIRPGFDRHVRRDRPWTWIGVFRIDKKVDREQRLRIRHQDEIHFFKYLQRAIGRRKVSDDLRNHCIRIDQEWPLRNVFVPCVSQVLMPDDRTEEPAPNSISTYPALL